MVGLALFWSMYVAVLELSVIESVRDREAERQIDKSCNDDDDCDGWD